MLFQLSYTTAFGWLATYLFLRTGHLLAPVLAHCACNYLGLPHFGRLTQQAGSTWGALLAMSAGVLLFSLTLPRLTLPALFENTGPPAYFGY